VTTRETSAGADDYQPPTITTLGELAELTGFNFPPGKAPNVTDGQTFGGSDIGSA
jgi:hypothetical protein